MTFSHTYPLYKHEWSREPFHSLRFLAQPLSVLCSPPTPSCHDSDFAKLIHFIFTFRWQVGSLQFRNHTFHAYRFPYTEGFFRVAFQYLHTFHGFHPFAQGSTSLCSLKRFISLRPFLTIRQNSLNVTVYMIARTSYQGYFIHSLSTLYFYNAPSLATRLTGDYRDRTYTGKCGPASLDTLHEKSSNDFIVITA